MIHLEAALMAIFALWAAYIFPHSGQLRRGTWLLVLSLVVFVTGISLFLVMDVWFKISYNILSIVGVYVILSIKESVFGKRLTSESVEANKMLGLSFQRQGLLETREGRIVLLTPHQLVAIAEEL